MIKTIIYSATKFAEWCSSLRSTFALDFETTSLDYLSMKIIGFSIYDGKQVCYVICNDSNINGILDILKYYINETKIVVFHNASFDIKVLKKYGIEFNPYLIFDTQVAKFILDENIVSYKLKDLVTVDLGIPKEKIVRYTDVIPNTPEFYEYGMTDAIYTYNLYTKYSELIEKRGLHHVAYDIDFPFTKVIAELESNGIPVDKQTAKEMQFEVRHLYYKVENELLEMFGGHYEVKIKHRSREVYTEPSINFNSPKQVIPLLESLGLKITETTDKGNKSLSKKSKLSLKNKHPVIELLDKLSKIQKLLTGFLEPFENYVDEDNRIRCSFHNTTAVTARLSCSSPNIEQLPKNNDIANIRNLFVTEPGNVFIVADYKGQELRILGEESQDKNLIRAFANNYDLHLATANNIYKLGLTKEELTEGTEAYENANIKHKKLRDKSKCINFGVAYGKGAYGFSKDFQCSEEEAQKFVDDYFNTYPAVKERIDRCRKQIRFKNYITNMSGRRRRFPDFNKLWKSKQERCCRQGFNFLIQSYAADMIKLAANKVVQDKRIKIVNIVHDELVCEVNKDYLKQVVAYIRDCMVNAVHMTIPLKVDITVATRYGEAK